MIQEHDCIVFSGGEPRARIGGKMTADGGEGDGSEVIVKISYDSEIDALYVRLVDGPQECRTVRLNDEIALNMGPGETLVGIEVLDAKQVLGQGKIPSVELENIPMLSGP
jgi:uncharacterized protein YuzE